MKHQKMGKPHHTHLKGWQMKNLETVKIISKKKLSSYLNKIYSNNTDSKCGYISEVL